MHFHNQTHWQSYYTFVEIPSQAHMHTAINKQTLLQREKSNKNRIKAILQEYEKKQQQKKETKRKNAGYGWVWGMF